ncbi:MAG TPA: DUF3102 domain-containing protein [Blastocatellia bacterium]|nr:DUF3102 domain-containing protein [Blastocatellia bacterium]
MNEVIETTQSEAAGQRALFDYSALDQETQITLRLRAGEIKTLAKRVAGDIVEIGGKLAEVKDRLGVNDKFNDWLSAELGWSERTAYNFIAVWQKFGAANFALENVATSALYLLAAPSTPAEAVEVARQIADSGEKVTHEVAKEIISQAKARKPKQASLIDEPAEEEELEGDASEEGGAAEYEGAAAEPIAEPEIAEATSPPAPAAKAAPQPQTAANLPAVAQPSKAAERPAAWYKTRIEIVITLMPGAEPRKIMHSVRAGEGKDDIPFVAVSSGEAELVEMLPPITRGLFEKAAKAFAEKPRPAAKTATKSKPLAKKPAAKAKKQGGKK